MVNSGTIQNIRSVVEAKLFRTWFACLKYINYAGLHLSYHIFVKVLNIGKITIESFILFNHIRDLILNLNLLKLHGNDKESS